MRGIFRAVIIILVSLKLAEVVFFNVNNDQVLSVLITEEIISKSHTHICRFKFLDEWITQVYIRKQK